MKNFYGTKPGRFVPKSFPHQLMKLKSTLATCLLGLGGLAALPAQDIKLNIPSQTTTAAPAAAPAPAAVAAPAPTYTDAQLLEEYGWLIGKKVGLADLNFTRDQVDQVLKGITSASHGQPTPNELEKIQPAMDTFIKKKQAEYITKLKSKSLSESAAFFTELKKRPGIVVLPSGLCYEIAKPGTGPAPKPTDTVTVNYTGTLIDSTVFDSSAPPREPVSFPLNQMIPGWVEGLQKIAKGGQIRLFIPPDLAFGDEGRPGIPPSSTLIFDVEILDIKDTPPAPMPTAPSPGTEAPPATPGK